jgi:hypothetical protein
MDQEALMLRTIAAVLGLFLGASAVWQMLAPLAWYDAVPGVVATGPFNAHFIRDIAAAYLTTAGGLIAFAWRPAAARPALLAAAAFLVMHAGVHVFDALCGARPLQDALRDLAAIHLVALVTLGLALAPEPKSQPQPLLKGAIRC